VPTAIAAAVFSRNVAGTLPSPTSGASALRFSVGASASNALASAAKTFNSSLGPRIRASKDGASGITVNQSNAMIAPVEIIESEFPTRMLRFELIRDSGGPGHFRGGLGIRREYVNLADARFSIRSTKHIVPPNGFADGRPGRTGDIWINPGRDNAKRLPTRYADYPLKDGDVFCLDTPGGGGYGDPLTRDPARVLDDVREGMVSREAAAKEYGVVLDAAASAVDEAATLKRRSAMRAKG